MAGSEPVGAATPIQGDLRPEGADRGTGHPRWAIGPVLIKAIRWYQRHLSGANPGCCKYYPTCSSYAIEAIGRYGACRGGILAMLRLLRCRPWSSGGIDDVPQHYSLFYRFSWSQAHEEPRLTPLAWSAGRDAKEKA